MRQYATRLNASGERGQRFGIKGQQFAVAPSPLNKLAMKSPFKPTLPTAIVRRVAQKL